MLNAGLQRGTEGRVNQKIVSGERLIWMLDLSCSRNAYAVIHFDVC